MHKITLYDYCCNPISDWTNSYFVDDLDDFEKNWKPIVQSEARIERYERSKNGEIVTDYHSDDEELNIVQEDNNSKVIEEKEFEKNNFDIELYNIYRCSSKFYIFNLKYKLRKIIFKEKYYIIAKYKISGIAEYNDFTRGDANKKFEDACFYGNPICNISRGDYEDFYSPTADLYKNDIIESFVWHIVWNREENMTLDELNEKELQCLLRDIVGEAG
ncbi:MAG: hypothetical protein IJ593_00460 [Lachnospiraceae bacterium]|nr:hypothetical protein [Lachnospiraceae bacterium]